MIIAAGSGLRPLKALREGAKATLFKPALSRHSARQAWLVGALSGNGVLVLDDGAARAVRQGKSLLPAGVSQVDGVFGRGDTVQLRGLDGSDIGRGIAIYDSQEALVIAGKRSADIASFLGETRGPNLIHADDLALF